MKISLEDVNNSSGLLQSESRPLYSHFIGRLKDYTLIMAIEFPILLCLFCASGQPTDNPATLGTIYLSLSQPSQDYSILAFTDLGEMKTSVKIQAKFLHLSKS